MATRRTLREWFAYLDDDKRPLTLDEFVAVMAFNSREYARLTLEMVRNLQNSGQHTEAMLSALDVAARAVANGNALPYPASDDVRRALDRPGDAT
jgi:hypothetical protein